MERINNNMNLHVVNTEKFKTISFSVLFGNTLNREDCTKTALLSQILKRGSKNFPSYKDYLKQTDELYGAIFDISVIKKGNRQILSFIIESLEKDVLNQSSPAPLEKAIEFVCDVITNPLVNDNGFDSNYYNAAKESLQMIINGRINDKKKYVIDRCIEEMFEDDPFALYGDGYIEDLERIDRYNIYEHYKKIISTFPADIVLVGNIGDKYESIKQKINEKLILQRDNIIKIEKTEPKTKREDIKKIDQPDNISQSKFCAGLTTEQDNTGQAYASMLVLNNILGGSANSKLFINAREKNSLCYYINSALYRFKSVIIIQAGIDSNDYDKVVAIIENEIENIKQSNFSDDELDNAKKNLYSQLSVMQDDNNSMLDYYMSGFFIGDESSIDDMLKLINNVCRDNVISVSKNIKLDTVFLLKQSNSKEASNERK